MPGAEDLLNNNPDPISPENSADFGTPGATPPAPAPAPAEPTPAPEPTTKDLLDAFTGLKDTMDGRFAEQEAKITEAIAANQQPAPTDPNAPKPGEEGWKPQTWDDFPALVEKVGREQAEKVLAEREAAAKQANDEMTAVQKQIDDEIDTQTSKLEKDGKIPAIVNEQDPNDPGKVARRELYGLAAWAGTPDLSRAQEMLDKYHETGFTFDVGLYTAGQDPLIRTNPTAPGKFAPVGSSSGTAGVGTSNSAPSYKDIASKSMDQLVDQYG